jgi:hypothetical protein
LGIFKAGKANEIYLIGICSFWEFLAAKLCGNFIHQNIVYNLDQDSQICGFFANFSLFYHFSKCSVELKRFCAKNPDYHM